MVRQSAISFDGLAGRAILAAHWLRAEDRPPGRQLSLDPPLLSAYETLMRRILQRRGLVLLRVVPYCFWVGFSYNHLGSGFMPKMDEGGFVLDYRAPPGTSLTETDRLLRQVEAILQKSGSGNLFPAVPAWD